MQKELVADSVDVHILGVNGAGHESDNAVMCAGRDLPWLQDQADAQDVWSSWAVVYRDVVILDRENQRIEAYNLSSHDLGQTASYEELKAKLLAAAQAAR